jgi:hypothetical protein
MMRTFFLSFPKLTLLASIGLFCLCLLNTGFYQHASTPASAVPGWQLLLFGWSAIPHGGVTWLANPVLGAAWAFFLMKHPGRSAGLAALALALMISFLFESKVTSIYSETSTFVAGYGPGYWLWVACASTLLLGGIVAALPTEFLDPERNAAP